MNIPTQFRSLPTLFLQAALIATATVLAIVIVSKFVTPIPFSVSQTTTQKESAFMVTGKSVVSTVPDKAEITLGISRKENDIKQAQSRSNDTINTITQKLVELGIKKDDIQTLNYSIYPNYDYQKSAQEIIGYSVDISIKVSLTDFDKLNKVVDIATAAGANQVNNIQMALSDDLEKQVRQDARAKAIEDAKANAQELARLSGVKLGKVINVSEGTTQSPGPIPYLMKEANSAMGGGAGAPTSIQPGSTSYTYNVTLSYETL
jgi:uncharacterized protein YggE